MNLGENIYRLRTERNLSQGDFADALEVSRQSVSKWENNSAVPELEKLMKMAELFGITLDELVTGATKEEPVAPPPQETPGSQAKRMLTTQQIIGIVLLGFGGLCFIVFTVVGIFTGNLLLDLFTGLPLMLCGLICLVYKKNIGLKCAWAVYLPLWVLFTIFLAR
jgi:transcriptional regulator with XRE-family HTH domain